MPYDWSRLDVSKRSLAREIEGDLTERRISFDDIRLFKDYKRSSLVARLIEYYRTIEYEKFLKDGFRFEEHKFKTYKDAALAFHEKWNLPDFEVPQERCVDFFLDSDKCLPLQNCHCDGSRDPSREVTLLYSLLWPKLVQKRDNNSFEFINSSLGRASGDTLSSFKTTYDRFSKIPSESHSELSEHLAMLAYLTHTPGNFIPIPTGSGYSINSKRGICSKIKDYFDLTLECIRRYYIGLAKLTDNALSDRSKLLEQNDAKSPLLGIIIGNGEMFKDNMGWLHRCGGMLSGEEGWRNFITSNFLIDYVDEDYHVAPLFGKADNRFSFESPYPKSPQFKECLVAMNARIIARNLRMRSEAVGMVGEKRMNWATDGKPSIVTESDIAFIFDGSKQHSMQ